MEPLLFLVTGISVVAAVMLFVLRGQDKTRADGLTARLPGLEKAKAEAETEARSRKETLEARTAELTEAKEKLREAKKKLHDEKEVNRKDEVSAAVDQAERENRAALETAHRETSEAQAEVKRLRAELEAQASKRAKKPEPEVRAAPAAAPVAAAPAVPAAPAEPRPPRALTEPEQNRMAVLEKQAIKQAERVKFLEEDAKRNVRRTENSDKIAKVSKSELEVARAKMTALERRLNRTLLELDKLRAAAFKAGLVSELMAAAHSAEVESEPEPTAKAEPEASSPASPVAPAANVPEAKA